ncbi:MAG: enoyl-CoA hydratase/isomerase family protein [Gemmatimonadetes bacterium]|nr:enoyl-CoA hydratase/isomerase family protein [Gemmatimonadota bacterium]
MSERLKVDLSAGVLNLTLNRPEKKNAIDTGMIDAFLEQLDRADLDAEVRVIAVRGAGTDFCAGMDLGELLASAERSSEENLASALHFGSIFLKMREIPKPVVALVQGRCLAGGMGLATGCDLIVAHAGASFGYPEIQRGFVPAIVMSMLRRLAGEKVAFDLVATGRILSAEEAAQMGLVSRVLPAETFDRDTQQLLSRLAGSSSTALALTKRQFYAIEGKTFSEAIRLGAEVNALARSTPDFKTAIAQFLKR